MSRSKIRNIAGGVFLAAAAVIVVFSLLGRVITRYNIGASRDASTKYGLISAEVPKAGLKLHIFVGATSYDFQDSRPECAETRSYIVTVEGSKTALERMLKNSPNIALSLFGTDSQCRAMSMAGADESLVSSRSFPWGRSGTFMRRQITFSERNVPWEVAVKAIACAFGTTNQPKNCYGGEAS